MMLRSASMAGAAGASRAGILPPLPASLPMHPVALAPFRICATFHKTLFIFAVRQYLIRLIRYIIAERLLQFLKPKGGSKVCKREGTHSSCCLNKLNNHAFREPPVASLADILSNVSSSDGVAWGQDSIMGWDEANQHEKSIIHQPRGARSEGNYPQHSPINPPDCPLSSEPSATASDSFDAVVTPGLRRVAARDRYGSEKGSDDRE
eukprot:1138408-Rhodomonas_salina.1